ncbi:rhodanese-like domain-containing protein [Ekhidna sp.]|uniref:sulfurtransferase n=1 Tax=Ekhidna sp. TaxID=2608089 RepID=UPI00329885AF
MKWNNIVTYLMLLVLMVGCNNPPEKEREPTKVTKYLIEAEELLPIVTDDTLVVLDLQRPEDFQKGHIKNSINIWRSELNNPSFKYDGMIPERDFLEEKLRSKGVLANAFIVLYDNRGSCEATRLWWVLKHYGYERMAILNGGTQGWMKLDTLTTEIVNRKRSDFELTSNVGAETSLNMLIADLSMIINNNEPFMLDTRSKDEFEGLSLKQGAKWAGRIPESKHIDWMEAVDQETFRFKEASELQKIYKEVINNEQLVVTYCHSGVRSTHTFFVLTELLGRKNVKNYDGSWVEWTHHFQPELVN